MKPTLIVVDDPSMVRVVRRGQELHGVRVGKHQRPERLIDVHPDGSVKVSNGRSFIDDVTYLNGESMTIVEWARLIRWYREQVAPTMAFTTDDE